MTNEMEVKDDDTFPTIEDARKLGKRKDCDMVIIVSAKLEENHFAVTTFGRTVSLCNRTQECGEYLEKAFCQWYQENM